MLQFGLIGLGSMGKNHYRILRSIPGIQLAAVSDPALTEKLPEKTYKDYRELLNTEKLDAVVIATPNSTHKEIAIAFLKKGVPVLIEKPVATTVAEGKEILKTANETKMKAAIGHIERFNPVVTSLKKELADKEIFNISITRVGPFPPRIANVGILNDLSVHDIDLIRFITQKEILKTNIFKSKDAEGRKENNAVLSFIVENDIIANVTTNWLTPFKKRTIAVATRECYYEADLISQELKQYSAYQANNSYVIRDHSVKKGEPLFNEIFAFAEYIRSGTPSDLATIEDSLRTLEILES